MKYKYLCLGCLKTTGQERDLYCSACRKHVFSGSSLSHRLAFNKDLLKESGHRAAVKRGVLFPDVTGEYLIIPIPSRTGIRYLEDIPANHHAMTQIASQIFGIGCAPSAMLFFANGEPGWIVRRFNTRRRRIDFPYLAQKSGEHDPQQLTYQGMARLIRRYLPTYLLELERFFTLLLFHYVTCNGEADARSFGLLQRESGDYGLAPAFSLHSSVIHDQMLPPMALPLFETGCDPRGTETRSHYDRKDFIDFADRIGIKEVDAAAIIDRFIEEKDRVFYLVERSLLSSAAKKIFKKFYLDRLYEISDTFGRPPR